MKTRAQQRANEVSKLQKSIRLELLLRKLIHEKNLVEFQQWIQYAPLEMKQRMLDLLENGKQAAR